MNLTICKFQSLNVVFSLFSVFKFEYEKNLKIGKSKMVATSDVIMLLWLPRNQLGATWFYLIGSILDTYYTYQVSYQLVEYF